MKRFYLVITVLLLLLLAVYFNKYSFSWFGHSTSTIIGISVLKMSKNDPFKNTIVKSQFFTINSEKDTVIEATHGTKIVLNKHCFVDVNGKEIKGEVTFELAEALTLDEVLLSNLTTTADNKLLETGGMLFTNVYFENKEVFINQNNPIYIEVPTTDFKPNMKQYQGVRDSKGNMNWINPKPLQNYLVSIDLKLLDFLPKGIENEVRSYHKKQLTADFIDSTYYQLSSKVTTKRGLEYAAPKGINPRIIKTIKSKAFQNTFIATKEFEKRLAYIFKFCDDKILELYINNLDKNLWEVDQIVANSLDSVAIIQCIEDFKLNSFGQKESYFRIDTLGYNNKLKNTFQNFANQRKTNVKNGVQYSKKLQGFYQHKLKENKAQFRALEKQIKEQDSLYEMPLNKLKTAYKVLVTKRQKYRMESYGFILTKTGWINIDRGTIPKKWDYQEVLVTSKPPTKEVKSHVYIVYESINSLLRLENIGDNVYQINDVLGSQLPMDKEEILHVVYIGSDTDRAYFGYQKITSKTLIKSANSVNLAIKETNKKEIKLFLKTLKHIKLAQQIEADIAFVEKINIQETKFKSHNNYIKRLEKIAFPNYKAFLLVEKD